MEAHIWVLYIANDDAYDGENDDNIPDDYDRLTANISRHIYDNYDHVQL